MEELIKQAFMHVEVIGPHVMEGHYDLLGPYGEIIPPQVWEATIEPDWSISMLMWPLLDVAEPSASAGSPSSPPPGDPLHPVNPFASSALLNNRPPGPPPFLFGGTRPPPPTNQPAPPFGTDVNFSSKGSPSGIPKVSKGILNWMAGSKAKPSSQRKKKQ